MSDRPDLTVIEGGKDEAPPIPALAFLELPPRSIEALSSDIELGFKSLAFHCARLGAKGALAGVSSALDAIGDAAAALDSLAKATPAGDE